jgi:hypothetical protein
MDGQDKIALAVAIIDVAVIVIAAFAGFLFDLAQPGMRWTRWRMSARSLGLLGACALGLVAMIVVPLSLLALGFPTTLVSPTGLLWLMALGGGIGFRISWSIDKKGTSGSQRA